MKANKLLYLLEGKEIKKIKKEFKDMTWNELMHHLKKIYPDSERMLDRISEFIDWNLRAELSLHLGSSSDVEIEGEQDLNLPKMATEVIGDITKWTAASRELKELVQEIPELRKFIQDKKNYKLSWRISDPNLPAPEILDPNLPDYGILIRMWPLTLRPAIWVSIEELMRQVGAHDLEKFKEWLKVVVDSDRLDIQWNGIDEECLISGEVEYIAAIYFIDDDLKNALKNVELTPKQKEKLNAIL